MGIFIAALVVAAAAVSVFAICAAKLSGDISRAEERREYASRRKTRQ